MTLSQASLRLSKLFFFFAFQPGTVTFTGDPHEPLTRTPQTLSPGLPSFPAFGNQRHAVSVLPKVAIHTSTPVAFTSSGTPGGPSFTETCLLAQISQRKFLLTGDKFWLSFYFFSTCEGREVA